MTPHRSHIRLKGAWLQRAGFAPGDRVEVRVEPGRLVIELKGKNHEANEGMVGAVDARGAQHTCTD